MARRRILFDPPPQRLGGEDERRESRSRQNRPIQIDYYDEPEYEDNTDYNGNIRNSNGTHDLHAVYCLVASCVEQHLSNPYEDGMIGVFGINHDAVIVNTILRIRKRNDALITNLFRYENQDLLGNICAALLNVVKDSDVFYNRNFPYKLREIYAQLDSIYGNIRSANNDRFYEGESALRRLSVMGAYQNRYEKIKDVISNIVAMCDNPTKIVMPIDIRDNINYVTLNELSKILNPHLVLIIHSSIPTNMMGNNSREETFSPYAMANPYGPELSKFISYENIFSC